jgi:transcriptional regulator with GAF, ATPase, and Fis domain
VCERSRREGRAHWCKLFDERAEHRRRCHVIRKDGSAVPVLKNASLLMADGEPVASVETLTDLSELVERERTIRELSRRLENGHGFHGLLGDSPPMRRVFRLLERAADSDAPVLILGESGTGKELAAKAIHDLGPRSAGPFIQLNCAALNESLLESELFGHVRGAFTGAVRHRTGRFEAAHHGDIFLDEIGDVPLGLQVKLLRVLETKTLERVGDHRPVHVDVRIISATNQDLARLVREGRFREDLLFRINVIPIHLPPLRERSEDVALLCDHFLAALREKSGKDVAGFTPEALALLRAHDWPGNVRELRSALEYAFVLVDSGRIHPEHLPPSIGASACPPLPASPPAPAQPPSPIPSPAPFGGRETRAETERRELVAALRRAGGNQSEAARLLGVHRGTVINRMRKYGIDLRTLVVEGEG